MKTSSPVKNLPPKFEKRKFCKIHKKLRKDFGKLFWNGNYFEKLISEDFLKLFWEIINVFKFSELKFIFLVLSIFFHFELDF